MSRSSNNSKPQICAVFDPLHLWLDSHSYSKQQIAKRRALHPNQLVATRSIQEWSNGNDLVSATRSISIVVISQERINKIRTARIRCCGGNVDLYLQKVVDYDDRTEYLLIQRTPPKFPNKVAKRKRKSGQRTLQSSNCIDWPGNGFVIAVICSIVEAEHVQTVVVEQVLTQSFGSPVNDVCLQDGLIGDLSASEFTPVPRRNMNAIVTTNAVTMMSPDEIKERRKLKRTTKNKQRSANREHVRRRSSSISFAEQLTAPLKPLFEPLHIHSGPGGKRRFTRFFTK